MQAGCPRAGVRGHATGLAGAARAMHFRQTASRVRQQDGSTSPRVLLDESLPSMALGEWLSVTNARELASTQIAQEREELEESPEAETKELALIFQAKGLP